MTRSSNGIGKGLRWLLEAFLFIGWFFVIGHLWQVFWGMEQSFIFYFLFGIIFLLGILFNSQGLWRLYQGASGHLSTKIVRALILGLGWALFSASYGWSGFTGDWIAPWGDIFLNVLKLIAVPLILFSIIKGISGISDVARLGRLGVKTLLFYVGTTFLAITVGLTVVNLFAPGEQVEENTRKENRKEYERYVHAEEKVDFKDDTRLLSEKEAKEAQMKGREMSPEIREKLEQAQKTKERGPLSFLVEMVPSNIFLSLNNSLMLQVIVFSIFFGVTLLLIDPQKAKPMTDFVDAGNEVFIKMVDVVMKAAPFFVFALLAGKITDMAGNDLAKIIELFKGLGYYALAVLLGLALLMFVIYPLVLIAFTKRISYRDFFSAMGPAQMLAFSTSSSAATLPLTMERVRDHLKVREEISGFVLPIGATVNMDGTSLYQGVAVVFLAQFHMVDLDLVQQLTIILTATLASIGSAAVPSAGIIMLIIVLESVGLDPTWIAIVLPIDRILDMCRTSVNITGDATVTSLIAKSEKDGFQVEGE